MKVLGNLGGGEDCLYDCVLRPTLTMAMRVAQMAFWAMGWAWAKPFK